MPRCTSPQPYTGSSGSNYGSLHYPPPQSDDRLRRLMLHDVSAPAESAVATDAFSVAAVSTSDGMSVILTGATARPKATRGSSYYGPASAATEARRSRRVRVLQATIGATILAAVAFTATATYHGDRVAVAADAAADAAAPAPLASRRSVDSAADGAFSSWSATRAVRTGAPASAGVDPAPAGAAPASEAVAAANATVAEDADEGAASPGPAWRRRRALAAVRDDDDDGVVAAPAERVERFVTRLRAREIA